MPSIIPATEYTNVSQFSNNGYVWLTPKHTGNMLHVRQPRDGSLGREELARIREMSDAHLSRNRLPDQDNFKDKERQLGKAMHSSEFVQKVLKLNPNILCEDSVNCRGHAAFYYVERGEKKYTNASFTKGILPEFSIIETDAADLPVRVKYGWREVLLRLVKARQLSFRQVVRMFGDAETVQSSHWRRNIRNFRR